jgi:hypothetical protein
MNAKKVELSLVKAMPDALQPEEVRRLVTAGKPHSLLDALVTPEVAKTLLEYNQAGQSNRKLSRATVDLLARSILDGTWENTGEAVIVSDAELLNDGQHRLEAVIAAGMPARMDLRFGVPRHAFAATNSGAKRTAAHALTLLGATNAVQVSTAARMVLAYDAGLPAAARQRIPNAEIVRAVEERWPDLPDAMRYSAPLPAQVRNAATMTLAFFASRTANEPAIRDFFAVLESGAGRVDDPPHRLREALLRHRGGQDTGTRVRFLALGIIAWNAFRKAPHRLSKLEWRPGEPFPRVDGLAL